MHDPILSGPRQEKLLVVSDSDRVDWVLMLIQSCDKEPLGANRLNGRHLGILELPLMVLCQKESLLLATLEVGDERRLRRLGGQLNLTVDVDSGSDTRHAKLHSVGQVVECVRLPHQRHIIQRPEDLLHLWCDKLRDLGLFSSGRLL